MSALRASGASDETIAYAQSIKRVISSSTLNQKSTSASTPASATGDAGNPGTSLRTSQRGYEVLTTNFARLIERLSTEKLYKPNEVNLQIASLRAFVKTMHEANTNVMTTMTAMKNGRAAQKGLFFGKAGLHGTAMETKDYIKSVFGAMSDQYGAVKSLSFKKE